MKLLKYSHNILLLLVGLLFIACQQERPLYQKSFTTEERELLAKNLTEGIGFYYQGSPGCQLMLEEALQLDPSNADVYREIGVPYLKRGIASAFPHYYGKAADLNPLSWLGWRGYLYLFFYRDYENALADFNLTDTITPNIVDYPQSISVDYMRGICYLQLNDYPKSIEYFNKHIQYETDLAGVKFIDVKTFLFLGLVHLKQGQEEKALSSFRQGLKVNSDNADLHFWIAKLSLKRGKLEKAIHHWGLAQQKFKSGYYNKRYYVEEFYQLYQEDLDELKQAIDTQS